MADGELELKHWTREEYARLIEHGIFMPDDRVELIDGLLVVAEPQSPYHYTAIGLVARALAGAFGEGWTIRAQGPVTLDATSEPEPDVAVVRGDLRDYARAHPGDPVLVVEVTVSSLTLDRRYKSSLYARAGRPEYWIVNLIDGVLEVRRNPALSASAPYGWDYSNVQTLSTDETVSPLAAPATRIRVGDLLP